MEVTVDLEDLRELVECLLDASIDARAERSLRMKLEYEDPVAATRWRIVLEAALPQAQIAEEERLHNLRSSFESASTVRDELARFVAPYRRQPKRRRT